MHACSLGNELLMHDRRGGGVWGPRRARRCRGRTGSRKGVVADSPDRGNKTQTKGKTRRDEFHIAVRPMCPQKRGRMRTQASPTAQGEPASQATPDSQRGWLGGTTQQIAGTTGATVLLGFDALSKRLWDLPKDIKAIQNSVNEIKEKVIGLEKDMVEYRVKAAHAEGLMEGRRESGRK